MRIRCLRLISVVFAFVLLATLTGCVSSTRVNQAIGQWTCVVEQIVERDNGNLEALHREMDYDGPWENCSYGDPANLHYVSIYVGKNLPCPAIMAGELAETLGSSFLCEGILLTTVNDADNRSWMIFVMGVTERSPRYIRHFQQLVDIRIVASSYQEGRWTWRVGPESPDWDRVSQVLGNYDQYYHTYAADRYQAVVIPESRVLVTEKVTGGRWEVDLKPQ